MIDRELLQEDQLEASIRELLDKTEEALMSVEAALFELRAQPCSGSVVEGWRVSVDQALFGIAWRFDEILLGAGKTGALRGCADIAALTSSVEPNVNAMGRALSHLVDIVAAVSQLCATTEAPHGCAASDALQVRILWLLHMIDVDPDDGESALEDEGDDVIETDAVQAGEDEAGIDLDSSDCEESTVLDVLDREREEDIDARMFRLKNGLLVQLEVLEMLNRHLDAGFVEVRGMDASGELRFRTTQKGRNAFDAESAENAASSRLPPGNS